MVDVDGEGYDELLAKFNE